MRDLPTITPANYYGQPINAAYMSASQFKAFMRCEAAALADVRGEIEREDTEALLVGSYVDAHFAGEMDEFRGAHQAIFTRDGSLKAPYRRADDIIARIERDELFSAMLAGNHQSIMTGSIAGVPFKAKLDSVLDEEQCASIMERWPEFVPHLMYADGAIVDLKVMRDTKPVWVPGRGRVSFVEAWGYDLQGAIYQEVHRQYTSAWDDGCGAPFFIAVATKEEATNIAILSMQDVAQRYVGGNGQYICCPFHAEKTPSMRLYERDYHCYGCGAHGDVVDFVGGVLSLKPMEAIKRINEDFALGLPVGRRATLREVMASRRAALDAGVRRRKLLQDIEDAESAYWTAFDAWKRWDRQLEDNRPQCPSDSPSEAFAEAVRAIDGALDDLEYATDRRRAAKWKYKQGQS